MRQLTKTKTLRQGRMWNVFKDERESQDYIQKDSVREKEIKEVGRV